MPRPLSGTSAINLTVLAIGALMLSACASVGSLFDRTPETSIPRPPPRAEGTPLVDTRTVANSDIPVLVNDQPITNYDIDQRVRIIRVSGIKGGRKAAIDELINEKVQSIEAARRGVTASDGQVDAAYGSIAQGLQLTPRQLDQGLRNEGINPKSLKDRLRVQILWGQLVNRRSQTEARLTSEELTARLLERDEDALTVTEVFLQQIVFVVPSGSPTARYTQRRREANAFRQRYQGCETALQLTRQLSGVVVNDIGRRRSDQLPGPKGEEINKTAVDKLTSPEQIDQGIEMIGVCSRRDVRSTAAARADIQNKYALSQAEDLGKEYLKELREAAIIEYR